MNRAMIIGQPGSGKSTLARRLGEKTGLPVYHMDQIHWQPGWRERPKAEKIQMAMEVQNRDSWIFEGGLSATKAHRLMRCDTLINLDLPLPLRAWRVAKRTLRHYGKSRPDLPENCPERFDREFWHWIWTTRHKNRAANLALMAEAGPETQTHHLTSPKAVAHFLQNL